MGWAGLRTSPAHSPEVPPNMKFMRIFPKTLTSLINFGSKQSKINMKYIVIHIFFFAYTLNILGQNLADSHLDSICNGELMDMHLIFNSKHIQDSITSTYSYPNTLFKLYCIEAHHNHDSLYGVSIDKDCFDSLVIAYISMGCMDIDTLNLSTLIDILMIINTISSTNYMVPQKIYDDFLACYTAAIKKKMDFSPKLPPYSYGWLNYDYSQKYLTHTLYLIPTGVRHFRNMGKIPLVVFQQRYSLRYGK